MSGLHLVRLTLSVLSPLSIGTGDVTFAKRMRMDRQTKQKVETEIPAAAIVRDADDLPTIPGPSYQGVLRRLAKRDASLLSLLGREDDDGQGAAGQIICTWARVHDQHDHAVTPGQATGLNDRVLALLRADVPQWRDHVALNGRHNVDDTKKFARTAVPKGTRFSLELALWGAKSDNRLTRVAALFTQPDFRLGASRNRGYGRVMVIRASTDFLPLSAPHAIRTARQETPDTALKTDILGKLAGFVPPDDTLTITLDLQATGLMRIGADEKLVPALTLGTPGARQLGTGAAWVPGTVQDNQTPRINADNVLRHLIDPVIRYPDTGTAVAIDPAGQDADALAAGSSLWALPLPLPGSEVRGAIAHRTLYWWNKAAGNVLTVPETSEPHADWDALENRLTALAARPAALAALFGAAKAGRRPPAGALQGNASALLVEDAELSADWVMTVDHVAIDRFTGGVRDREGLLYAEDVLVTPRAMLTLRLPRGTDTGEDAVGGWPRPVAIALLKALRDLCTDRLPIGAGSLGSCTGSALFRGGSADAWAALGKSLHLPLAPAPEAAP